MSAEELSQEEIDSLFASVDSESDSDGGSDEINPEVKQLADLLNSSIEEVFKTAFSLEVVSKFIDLNIKKKEDVQLEDSVFVHVEFEANGKKQPGFIRIERKFASILADLMLMGPGEPKEELEPDDLDALKELFSQVFGNLQTVVKEKMETQLGFSVSEVTLEYSPDDETYYAMEFDVAIPNVEDGTLRLCVGKAGMDALFEKPQAEPVEEEEEGVPFKDVEEQPQEVSKKEESRAVHEAEKSAPDNLDLILDVDLDVKVRIGKKSMLIKDVLELKDGSIIELEKNIEEPMEILINNKVVAKGVVVVVGGRFGVKITSIETKEERIKSLGG